MTTKKTQPIQRFMLLLTTFSAVLLLQQSPARVQPLVNQEIADALVSQLQMRNSNSLVIPRVSSTVQADGYAIANWIWGEAGGQAVLQRQSNNDWRVIRTGGGVVSTTTLVGLGVPSETIEALMNQLVRQSGN